MANYVIKEMPAGMGNGKKGRIFPKMQVYTEFDYDKVVELVHTNSPAFSEATIRGVLDTLAVVMKSYLPLGHTMKIDNLGVFSLSLEFADNEAETGSQQEAQESKSKKKYHHARVNPCSPRDSQESSPAPQFKSINSLALSFLYSPTLISIHSILKSRDITLLTNAYLVKAMVFPGVMYG